MRQEYLDLQEVGGLTVNNSLLNQANVIQDLKDHQQLMTNNLKSDITTNLMNTFKALNLVEENVEDEYQSNQENIPQYVQYSGVSENQMMMAMKGNTDTFMPLMEKMMKQMVDMQEQLQNMKQDNNNNSGNRDNNGGNSRKSTATSPINPKTGQPWKQY